MRPERYALFYCHRCGWSMCVFIGSDIYKRYERARKYPPCPYCKTSGTGVHCVTDADDGTLMADIKEPIRLRYPIPKKHRKIILEKYNHACALCGSTDGLQIDHIVAVVDGGTNDLDNLRVLCKACNTSKGANSDIGIARWIAVDIKDRFPDLVGKSVSMAEVSRVTGIKYSHILACQREIRDILKIKKGNAGRASGRLEQFKEVRMNDEPAAI